MTRTEIVRVTYNERCRGAAKTAEQVGKQIKDALSDENLIIYPLGLSYAGTGEIIGTEVVIDFPMSNIDAAKRIVGKIEALGIPSRTYHDCD